MSANLTSWFLCVDAQPSRPGWYDISYDHGKTCTERLRWDGIWWWHPGIPRPVCFGRIHPIVGHAWRGQVQP